MDFTIRTDLIPRATKPYHSAADGDTIVAIHPFTFGGVQVPSGTTATYRDGNITELPNGERFAWDHLDDFPVMVVPNSLDYPPGHQTEPDMTPDVIERADVMEALERLRMELPHSERHWVDRFVDMLPKPETGHEVKVAVYVQATSQHDANEIVRDALPRSLDAVVLS